MLSREVNVVCFTHTQEAETRCHYSVNSSGTLIHSTYLTPLSSTRGRQFITTPRRPFERYAIPSTQPPA